MIHLIHEAPLGSRTLPLLFIITLYNNKKKLHYLSQQLRKMRAKNESLPGCYKCFLITGFFFTTNAAFWLVKNDKFSYDYKKKKTKKNSIADS